jgi:hypothetical protein
LFNKPIFANKYDVKLGVIFQGKTDTKGLLDVMEKTVDNLGVKMATKKYEAKDRSVKGYCA